jgi:hypothetical protein
VRYSNATGAVNSETRYLEDQRYCYQGIKGETHITTVVTANDNCITVQCCNERAEKQRKFEITYSKLALDLSTSGLLCQWVRTALEQ